LIGYIVPLRSRSFAGGQCRNRGGSLDRDRRSFRRPTRRAAALKDGRRKMATSAWQKMINGVPVVIPGTGPRRVPICSGTELVRRESSCRVRPGKQPESRAYPQECREDPAPVTSAIHLYRLSSATIRIFVRASGESKNTRHSWIK
jgi:hypothetical protein